MISGKKEPGITVFRQNILTIRTILILINMKHAFLHFFLFTVIVFFQAVPALDNFYSKQEESGAIRWRYSEEDGAPIISDDNPEGVSAPLFAWAEYNIYHKIGQKKRLKEVVPVLEKYYAWLEETFQADNGLYAVPLSAVQMGNSPRDGGKVFN